MLWKLKLWVLAAGSMSLALLAEDRYQVPTGGPETKRGYMVVDAKCKERSVPDSTSRDIIRVDDVACPVTTEERD